MNWKELEEAQTSDEYQKAMERISVIHEQAFSSYLKSRANTSAYDKRLTEWLSSVVLFPPVALFALPAGLIVGLAALIDAPAWIHYHASGAASQLGACHALFDIRRDFSRCGSSKPGFYETQKIYYDLMKRGIVFKADGSLKSEKEIVELFRY